jgi:hypothetical protein
MCEHHRGKCPVYYDYIGKTIKVFSRNTPKNFLFSVNEGAGEVEAVWYDLYCAQIQWFEPGADKYMKLKEAAWNITSLDSFKHFTWQQIVDFSEVDRASISYASGWAGDWKKSEEGAAGFPLVEIGGKPYWSDAVGQIPFAVDTFRAKLEATKDKEKAVKATLAAAQHHPTGNIVPTWNPVISNQYDDYFVLRGALWASRRYDLEKHTVKLPIEHGMNVDTERYKVVKKGNPPAHLLANSVSPETAKAYGLGK